jgi:hypothetical protein
VRGHFRPAVGLANEPSHEQADVQASLDQTCQSPMLACYGQPNASSTSDEPLDKRLQGSLESFEVVLAMAHEESHEEVVKGKGEIILLQNTWRLKSERKCRGIFSRSRRRIRDLG